jgi:dCMP deaminase
MYVTHNPCPDCAKSIVSAGIKEVLYAEDYRDKEGIKFLEDCGVYVKKLNVKSKAVSNIK